MILVGLEYAWIIFGKVSVLENASICKCPYNKNHKRLTTNPKPFIQFSKVLHIWKPYPVQDFIEYLEELKNLWGRMSERYITSYFSCCLCCKIRAVCTLHKHWADYLTVNSLIHLIKMTRIYGTFKNLMDIIHQSFDDMVQVEFYMKCRYTSTTSAQDLKLY